ncbi:UNVERIFIED_CONTAM: hypothetical protein Slati_0497100 [Sesamum latifolium]|uniref:Gag-pol polyprotein n=1 Tax=Sesamum latifolium TaxID=2727402 RepID=A0AAW2XZM4_9LAMI
METNKFNGTNYTDWLRNLRIVLDFENQGYVLDKPLPATLPEGFSPEERLTFEKCHEDNRKVRSIILASMTNEIQKQCDRLEDVSSIMLHMKEVYAVPDRHIRYAASKVFFRTKMAKGSSVQSHRVKMLSLVEKLEDLKAGLNNDTYIDVILQSLPPSYDPFVVNYNMNGLEKSIHELINMLVQYEATTHKSKPTVLVEEASTSKAKGRGAKRWKRKKSKGTAVTATTRTGGAPPAAPKGKGKGKVRGSQQLKVLKRSRKLSKDEMILRLGDGKAVAAEAVGSLSLVVSNHIRIDLKDCYFVPINDLYILQQSNLIMTAQHKRKMDNHENAQIWHARLAHISKDRIRRFARLKESRNRQFGSSTNLRVLSEGKDDQEALCWTKRDRQQSVGLGPYRCLWTIKYSG